MRQPTHRHVCDHFCVCPSASALSYTWVHGGVSNSDPVQLASFFFPLSLLSDYCSPRQWGKLAPPTHHHLLVSPAQDACDTVSESLTTSPMRNIISWSADWCTVALVFSLQVSSQNTVFLGDLGQLPPHPPSRSVRWCHAFVTQLHSSVTIRIPSWHSLTPRCWGLYFILIYDFILFDFVYIKIYFLSCKVLWVLDKCIMSFIPPPRYHT